MIHSILSFVKLSPQRKKIFVQTFGFAIYTSLLFKFFKRRAKFAGNATVEIDQTQKVIKINDIAWAIHTVDKYLWWKNVCRHQAYQAKLLCNYYKIPCQIFVGIKKDNTKNEIQAHAWVVAAEKMIVGFCNPEDYVIQGVYTNKWR